MLVEKIIELKQQRIRQSPCHSNRASELGHVCERYLTFRRVRWQDATLHDVSLQFLFDEGALHEWALLRECENAGLRIIEQQRDYEDKPTNITGHLDAKIVTDDGKAYPLEIKSMSPYIWDRINGVEDLLKGAVHLRKYPAQLQLYMFLSNSERGVLLLKNKATGQIKEFWMDLDYEFANDLLEKAKRINQHVGAGTIPPPIPYEEGVCGRCPFLHICLPEIKRDALDLVTDPDLEAKLARRAELAPLAKEYETVDKEVKAAVKEHEKVVIGDWLITGKWIEKTVPPQPEKHSRYWQSKIQSLEPVKGESHE